MADDFVGPYQIPQLVSDENVARVSHSRALARAVNNGMSKAEEAAKAVAYDAVGLRAFDFSQAVKLRDATYTNAATAEQAAADAATVKAALEAVYLGGEGTVADNAVATYAGTVGAMTHGVLEGRYDVKGRLGRSVADFGAVGDGVADDSEALLAAINAAHGEQVWLPEGRYKTHLSITDQPINLAGPGVIDQASGLPAITVARPWGTPRNVHGFGAVVLGLPAYPNGYQKTCMIQMSTEGVKQGDVLYITSEDFYPWSESDGQGTFQAGCFPVAGIGVTASRLSGGVNPRQVVTGATSGATGIVASVTREGDTQHIVFSSTEGTFLNEEELLTPGNVLRGVAATAPYVVTGYAPDDVYTTNVTARVIPQIPLNLDVEIASDLADIYSNVDGGSTTRRAAAIQVQNQVGGRIRALLHDTYGRGLQLRGATYGMNVRVDAHDLPNIADTSQGAYGYGVEVIGAAEKNNIQVFGRNLRHGFTTNIVNNSTWAASNLAAIGTAKRNVVTGVTVDTLSAGFDTHAGAYGTLFHDCKVIHMHGSGRFQTANSASFNDRGFNTRYENCTSVGGYMGFFSSSHTREAPFYNNPQYVGCHALDYSHSGFETSRAAPQGSVRLQLEQCTAKGNGSAQNDPSYQIGFAINGVESTSVGCISSDFNGAPWAFRGYGPLFRGYMLNCFGDYRRSPSPSSAIRLDGSTDMALRAIGYTVRGGSHPHGYFRAAGSGVMSLRTDGVTSLANPQALVHSGTVNVTIEEKITS